jgi:hypothetical protein
VRSREVTVEEATNVHSHTGAAMLNWPPRRPPKSPTTSTASPESDAYNPSGSEAASPEGDAYDPSESEVASPESGAYGPSENEAAQLPRKQRATKAKLPIRREEQNNLPVS